MKFGGIFVALLLSLAACSSDPVPREPQKTSVAPSPAPVSTATLPPLPEQAREDSPEGAAAFVDHWVDVFNYAAATGDVDELSKLSSPDCTGCQDYISTFAQAYRDGGYFRNADWQVEELKVQESDLETYATFVANTESGEYRTSSDSPVKRSTGADNEVSLAMKKSTTSWTATQLGLGEVE